MLGKGNLIQTIAALFIMSCADSTKKNGDLEPEIFECSKGTMSCSKHILGQIEEIPFKNLENKFQLILDTSQKAKNFVSERERIYYTMSQSEDTSYLTMNEEWTKLSSLDKKKYLKSRQYEDLQMANELHIETNKGQQLLWIVNNSLDTVKIQRQDGSLIYIIEGKTKNVSWSPIEYWEFSECGNSYSIEKIAPKTARSLIIIPPKKGDYKTLFRIKLLGKNNFYFSNEFEGQMDYCQFVEDFSNYIPKKRGYVPHYTLDTFLQLSME